jgi:hypothetical protein
MTTTTNNSRNDFHARRFESAMKNLRAASATLSELETMHALGELDSIAIVELDRMRQTVATLGIKADTAERTMMAEAKIEAAKARGLNVYIVTTATSTRIVTAKHGKAAARQISRGLSSRERVFATKATPTALGRAYACGAV